MAESNDNFKESFGRVLGSLSGWDLITTNTEGGKIPTSDHEYTEQDLFVLLKKLKNNLDEDHIFEIEELILKHIADENNPHKVDLSKMNTSFIQELYKLWLANGYEGSREEFLKQLFQYITIADIETTLRGEALDQVTSVKGVATLVDVHNTDENAHLNMFSKLFPGEEIQSIPTLGIHGFIGIPSHVNITRSGTLNIVDKTGFIRTLASNTLDCDFTFQDGAFPIFDANKNYLTDSINFNNTSKYTVTNASVSKSTFVPHMSNPNDTAWFLQETAGSNPLIHSIKPATGVSVTSGETYNVSFFCYPVARTCCGIKIPTAVIGNQYSFVHFDFVTGDMFINDTVDKTKLNGGFTRLPNGWYRCWITVTAVASTTLIPEIYPLDIYDGDFTYPGVAGAGMCIFGMQVSDGILPPPYIESNGSAGVLNKTTITIPLKHAVSDWYRYDQGTFVTEVTNVPYGFSPKVNHQIYTVADGSANIGLDCRFPPNNAGRTYVAAYNDSNQSLYGLWSTRCNKTHVTIVQSYDGNKKQHLFGYYDETLWYKQQVVTTQVNSKCTTLYLGCSRYNTNCLNGYLKSFCYYPAMCTIDNIKFFLGE